MVEFNKINILEYSPIALALIGDGVHTLFVREKILKLNNITSGRLHLESAKKCKASAQSEVFDKIKNELLEDELAIANRARNHKTHSVKNNSIEDYKKATAFEALIGYLYLLKQYDRMNEILEKSFEYV